MLKRFLILIPSLYILALFQASFFIHFGLSGFLFNFIFILVIILNLFAPSWGVESALIGGFFLDVFSANFMGFNVLIFLGLAIFIKVILRKYVRSPIG